MAAYVVVTINDPNNTIQHLKDRVYRANNAPDTTAALAAYIQGIAGGAFAASVQVTIRDTDPSVTTSGTGSVQQTHNHK